MPAINDKMISSAFDAMEYTMEFNSSDKILIVSDNESGIIAKAFESAARKKKCEITNFYIKNNERPLKEVPVHLLELLQGKTIVLNIIKAFAEEIAFRIKWIFAIEERKNIRCAHMPGITKDMMTEGPMNTDYKKMKSTAESLIAKLQNVDYLKITTDAGTNLNIRVRGRSFQDDVYIKPGMICNLPCGEIYCAPEEDSTNGKVIFDASIGDIGKLKTPLEIKIKNGKIRQFKSDDKNLLQKIKKLSTVDDDSKTIGELGIGINPGARIKGNMLEDEKAIGTAHIAFGNNEDFGGKNKSKIHRDFLFNHPSIEVNYLTGEKQMLMEKGQII